MKKILIIIAALAVFLVVGFYTARNYLLPQIIAKSVNSDKPAPSYLPKKIENTVNSVKKGIDENFDQLPIILNKLNLDFDDLIRIIDNVDAKEIMKAQNELYNSDIQSTNQAYDIVVKNVHLQGYDLEIFRPIFNEKMTVRKINKFIKIAEDHQLQTSISIPMARNTAKQILMNNREKIESELAKINN